MKPHIEKDACSGTGTCARLAPKILEMVPDGDHQIAVVIPNGEATEDELWDAAQACPWDAVILESDDGRVLYP